jgi:hypothetical protein
MTVFRPELEHVGNCAVGELVRLQRGQETYWAITCKRQSGFAQSLLILNPSKPPKTINIINQGRMTDDFAIVPALKYGKSFVISPDHTGPIAIVAGELSKVPGRILQSGGEFYITAERDDGGIDYVSLLDWVPVSEPANFKAAYSRWSLTHEAILKDGKPAILFEYDASKSLKKAKAA